MAGGKIAVDAPAPQAFDQLREAGYEAYVPAPDAFLSGVGPWAGPPNGKAGNRELLIKGLRTKR